MSPLLSHFFQQLSSVAFPTGHPISQTWKHLPFLLCPQTLLPPMCWSMLLSLLQWSKETQCNHGPWAPLPIKVLQDFPFFPLPVHLPISLAFPLLTLLNNFCSLPSLQQNTPHFVPSHPKCLFWLRCKPSRNSCFMQKNTVHRRFCTSLTKTLINLIPMSSVLNMLPSDKMCESKNIANCPIAVEGKKLYCKRNVMKSISLTAYFSEFIMLFFRFCAISTTMFFQDISVFHSKYEKKMGLWRIYQTQLTIITCVVFNSYILSGIFCGDSLSMGAFTAEKEMHRKLRLMAAIFIVTTSLKWCVVLQVSPFHLTLSYLYLILVWKAMLNKAIYYQVLQTIYAHSWGSDHFSLWFYFWMGKEAPSWHQRIEMKCFR